MNNEELKGRLRDLHHRMENIEDIGEKIHSRLWWVAFWAFLIALHSCRK